MIKYHIAIPSYCRSQILIEKTLSYLRETDINMRNVHVFVANKEEYKIYHALLIKMKFSLVNLIEGVPTLCGQRAYMRSYFGKGANVFFIDDDVDGLYSTTGGKWTDMYLVKNLDARIRSAFSYCKQFNISLWGFNAVCNPFFMFGKGDSMDLKYICGAAYGEVIIPRLDVTLEDKEDFERSILHFIEKGKVLRFNSVGIKTKYYNTPGGMQVTRTEKRVSDSAMKLLKRYPKHCKLNTGKKNQKHVEIKLIKQ